MEWYRKQAPPENTMREIIRVTSNHHREAQGRDGVQIRLRSCNPSRSCRHSYRPSHQNVGEVELGGARVRGGGGGGYTVLSVTCTSMGDRAYTGNENEHYLATGTNICLPLKISLHPSDSGREVNQNDDKSL